MLAAALAGYLISTAPLQEGQPLPDKIEDIVVLGRSVEQEAQAYIRSVGAAPRGMRLARWDRTFCTGVTGLDPFYAQYILDRISAVAASVGINPGDPGCRPDILIAFTRDPDALADAWVSEDPDLFRPARQGDSDLGAEGLQRFRTSDAPVRWWHVSLSVNAQTGATVTRTTGDGPPMNQINTPSLIQSSTRERLTRIFIVVDAAQIQQTSFGSLADYLSLVALAQVDPLAETEGLDTVLNLFTGQPAARLSPWDTDYVRSLYLLGPNAIRSSIQERQIARALAERRAGAVDVENAEVD